MSGDLELREHNILVDLFELDERLIDVVVVVEPELATEEPGLEVRLVPVEQLAESEDLAETELAVRLVVDRVEEVAVVVWR